MITLRRVKFNAAGVDVYGKVAARREKTRQIYVIIDGGNCKSDDWFAESSWTEVDAE